MLELSSMTNRKSMAVQPRPAGPTSGYTPRSKIGPLLPSAALAASLLRERELEHEADPVCPVLVVGSTDAVEVEPAVVVRACATAQVTRAIHPFEAAISRSRGCASA